MQGACLRASLPCTGVCHCKKLAVKMDGHLNEGVEIDEIEQFHNYSDNNEATELDVDESTST